MEAEKKENPTTKTENENPNLPKESIINENSNNKENSDNKENSNTQEKTKEKEKEKEKVEEDSEIIEKIKKIKSSSMQHKLLQINDITNVILYDKEDKFHEEYKQIRGKYEKNSFNVYKKISDIINGKINCTSLLTEDDYAKYGIQKDKEENDINNYKPIDNFWLKAIKNSEYFELTKNEEKILENLKEIKIELDENNIDLKIKYYFDENEFFKKNIIYKCYKYNKSNEKLEKSEFSEIEWKNKKFINDNKRNSNKKKFFDMFDKDKINNDLDQNEANFIKNDFFPGILSYYMGFVDSIKDDDDFSDEEIKTFTLGKVNLQPVKSKKKK